MKPLCFVLMPFGEKPDPTGGKVIDFDRVYETGIRPAIDAAGMDSIRADEERVGGIIHAPMFERLLLCEFAIADLTTANANVFYELGIRHAARPRTTVTIRARHQPIPFDINFLRSLAYDLGDNNAFPSECAEGLRSGLADVLGNVKQEAQHASVDSPLFNLIGEWRPEPIAREKTDTFRDQIRYNESIKQSLAAIRELAKDSATRNDAVARLAEQRETIGDLDAVDGGVAIDLMLTYRALSDWQGMINVQRDMPKTLADQVMVQEQLAFALNRSAKNDRPARKRALEILEGVEERQGPSSETCGLMGRIHKDLWLEAVEGGKRIEATGHLNSAIDAYVRGFFADQRDAYPGINAVTLLDVRGDAESIEQKDELVPVVRFAVRRRLAGQKPDYWDHATMLELAVLQNEPDEVGAHLGKALSAVRESWEPRTTANNLRLIRRARQGRGEATGWLDEVIASLTEKQAEMETQSS